MIKTVQDSLKPQLRFPKFTENWKRTKVGSVSHAVTSGARDWGQYYAKNGAKFIRMTNLSRDGIALLLHDLKYVSLPEHGSEKARTALQPDDILVSITAELGKIGFVPYDLGEAYINQHTALVRPNKESIEPIFLAYHLSTAASNKRLNRLNDSGAKAGLNLSTVRGFSFYAPTKNEQRKIAAFLGTADSKLNALRRKRALLADYKRGVMQKLFTQEIRFVGDGERPFADWERKKLVEVAKDGFSNGVFNDPKNVGAGYKLINVKDMYQGNYIDISQLTLIDLSPQEFAKNKVHYGDIFFTRSSLVKEGIAYSNVFLGNQSDVTYDGHLIKMSLDTDSIDPYFFAQMLRTHFLRRQIVARGKTGTMTTIGQDDMASVIVYIPELEEQQKIANFLTAIDNKITAVDQQITHMETFKKGLLQQMFV